MTLADQLRAFRAISQQATTVRPWIAERRKPWCDSDLPSDRCDGIHGPHSHGSDKECWVEVTDCPAATEIVTTDSGVYGPNWPDAVLLVTAVNAFDALVNVAEKALELKRAVESPVMGHEYFEGLEQPGRDLFTALDALAALGPQE